LFDVNNKASGVQEFYFFITICKAAIVLSFILVIILPVRVKGDDEQIKVDLKKIPENIAKVAVAVTIYDATQRKQNFGQVSKVFVRVVNELKGQKI